MSRVAIDIMKNTLGTEKDCKDWSDQQSTRNSCEAHHQQPNFKIICFSKEEVVVLLGWMVSEFYWCRGNHSVINYFYFMLGLVCIQAGLYIFYRQNIDFELYMVLANSCCFNMQLFHCLISETKLIFKQQSISSLITNW